MAASFGWRKVAYLLFFFMQENEKNQRVQNMGRRQTMDAYAEAK